VLPPSFTTVGTPSLVFMLKSGRGLDAKNGAKSQDKEGRLKFQFHSFASFNKASRFVSSDTSIGVEITRFPLMKNHRFFLGQSLVCGKQSLQLLNRGPSWKKIMEMRAMTILTTFSLC
jgi:hypothetical protein